MGQDDRKKPEAHHEAGSIGEAGNLRDWDDPIPGVDITTVIREVGKSSKASQRDSSELTKQNAVPQK